MVATKSLIFSFLDIEKLTSYKSIKKLYYSNQISFYTERGP